MKESFWGYFIIILGLFVIVIMMVIQNMTTTSEEDFYLSKEVMEAAMLDSVDYGVYRTTGEIRIIESKFVENFTRRFADSVSNSKDYTIEFYEIYENPPKATVLIKTNTGEYRASTDTTVDFDIVTALSGILATKYTSNAKLNNVVVNVINGYADEANKYTTQIESAEGVTFNIKAYEGYKLTDAIIDCPIEFSTKIEKDTLLLTVKNVSEETVCNVTLQGLN